jgi:GT2 family glycosyltransferase
MISYGSICLSVVSHGQADLLDKLLRDLSELKIRNLECVIVTSNISGSYHNNSHGLNVIVIENRERLGFSKNHNQAFINCEADFFCVCNPDVSLTENPFPGMLECLRDVGVGIVVPRISNSRRLQPNIRRSPTLWRLIAKIFGFHDHVEINTPCMEIEWGAGMFQLFKSSVYKELNGFDERFFLYYEDVDICERARKLGTRVVVCASAFIRHDARCDSHKNLNYAYWHAESMLRFFVKKYIYRSYSRGTAPL